ncbi:MAG: V-type ATP synthase subunit F [Oscillospiraceae bacterium]|jgi:V/A-type H+-transporting ATPase subunit F|nr:V-type ATP synthase subunit F [Oscillospiraceae bacterium]
MHKIAILGEYDSIYGFESLGFEVFGCKEFKEVEKHIKRLSLERYAIIFITESFAKKEVLIHEKDQIPAIVFIPSLISNKKIGVANLRKLVEKAVGSDIL